MAFREVPHSLTFEVYIPVDSPLGKKYLDNQLVGPVGKRQAGRVALSTRRLESVVLEALELEIDEILKEVA